MRPNDIFIYGKHPVHEALVYCPDVIREIFLKEDFADDKLLTLIAQSGIQHSRLRGKELPGGFDKGAVHQGIIAVVSESKLVRPYKSFISQLTVTPDTALLIFGEVQDPHNIGAVIRSAAAFGISGVLIPPHKQAQVNGTVIKVSTGTAFRIPLVSISNVNTTLRDLKERGFWTYGLDEEGETSLVEERFEKPSVFVLGNEGTGLRKMTKEACDQLLSIPISSQCDSLNASASASVVFYEWARQHRTALS